jgi:ATP-binding cassette, subfamily B (MDR/TAP), member 1
LYQSILRKNIGWFDDRENGVSVLTSAMAQDTSIINGVSSESLAPQLEGGIALILGILIGFIFCWQESLVCLAVSPVMIIGNKLGIKFQQGLVDEQNELQKEANLLCGDAIINYRTV